MPSRELGDAVCKKQIQDHVVNQMEDHPASADAERTHLKYSGNEPDIIACLISRMMSRYRRMLCRVASTAYRISPDWNRWRRYARE